MWSTSTTDALAWQKCLTTAKDWTIGEIWYFLIGFLRLCPEKHLVHSFTIPCVKVTLSFLYFGSVKSFQILGLLGKEDKISQSPPWGWLQNSWSFFFPDKLFFYVIKTVYIIKTMADSCRWDKNMQVTVFFTSQTMLLESGWSEDTEWSASKLLIPNISHCWVLTVFID